MYRSGLLVTLALDVGCVVKVEKPQRIYIQEDARTEGYETTMSSGVLWNNSKN